MCPSGATWLLFILKPNSVPKNLSKSKKLNLLEVYGYDICVTDDHGFVSCLTSSDKYYL
jgi:hypothetical protein